MNDKPQHNSGAELEALSKSELRRQLRSSFPGGARWMGLTHELGRRGATSQQRLTILALVAAVVAAIASVAALFK